MTNYELLQLIRETGYFSDAELSTEQRYNLLTNAFWRNVARRGYDVPALRSLLWRMAGRSEGELLGRLPPSHVEKAVEKALSSRATSRDRKTQQEQGIQGMRQKIKDTAEAIMEMYRRGEKEIQAAIDQYLDNPDRLRAETDRIRREMLVQAATWLGVSVPGLYVTGSRMPVTGAHADAIRALTTQEFHRFKELDAQIGRHIENVIAEAEHRRAQAELAGQREPDYSGLKGKIIGYKTIDGKELSISDYIKLLALTSARNFYNAGVQNGMLHRREDLALISREVRRNTCDACRRWAGRIVSISGRTPGYPLLQDALDDGIMHPHCIHYLLPVEYEGST